MFSRSKEWLWRQLSRRRLTASRRRSTKRSPMTTLRKSMGSTNRSSQRNNIQQCFILTSPLLVRCPSHSPWALLLKPLAYSILASQFTLCQIKRAQYYCLQGVGGRLQHDKAGHARFEGEGQVGQLELQEGDDQVSLLKHKSDSFTWKIDHLFQGGRHETIYWVCEAAVWETRQKVLKRLYVYGKIWRRQIKKAVYMQENIAKGTTDPGVDYFNQ